MLPENITNKNYRMFTAFWQYYHRNQYRVLFPFIRTLNSSLFATNTSTFRLIPASFFFLLLSFVRSSFPLWLFFSVPVIDAGDSFLPMCRFGNLFTKCHWASWSVLCYLNAGDCFERKNAAKRSNDTEGDRENEWKRRYTRHDFDKYRTWSTRVCIINIHSINIQSFRMVFPMDEMWIVVYQLRYYTRTHTTKLTSEINWWTKKKSSLPNTQIIEIRVDRRNSVAHLPHNFRTRSAKRNICEKYPTFGSQHVDNKSRRATTERTRNKNCVCEHLLPRRDE